MRVAKKLVVLSLLGFLAVLFSTPTVSAYTSGPIKTGDVYDYVLGNVCASYAFMTTYDAWQGGNDPFFFPGATVVSASVGYPSYWVSRVRIQVTGTKPNGQAVTGIEFTNLAALDSPHFSGSDWAGVLKALASALTATAKVGFVNDYLKFGEAWPTVGFGSGSAWAQWDWNGMAWTQADNKGLQFRFSLHCDPDLKGPYLLRINYAVWIVKRTGSGSFVFAGGTEVNQYFVYDFGSTIPPGGGCPILSVYNGDGYATEGLLNIHNPDGKDIVATHMLVNSPEAVNHRYLLRLTEHPKTISHIDQVQLFAQLRNGRLIRLPLLSAMHSAAGDITPQLRLSDDVRVTELGAENNNGVSEYIDLQFAASTGSAIAGFMFVIEGYNAMVK